MIMKVDAEVLRELDPRKSYDRGAWSATDTARSAGITHRIGPTVKANIATLSTEALRRELERRQSSLAQLQARRAQLLQELASLEEQIGELGGSDGASAAGPAAPRARRTLPRNSINLADALAAAVEVRAVVSPTEAAELVRANGYVSNARNFAQVVCQTLTKDKRFKRVERGQYERVS